MISPSSMKHPRYLKSFLLGFSSLILPVITFGQSIPRVDLGSVSDLNKVKSDYLKSFEGIQKEVAKIDYRK